MNTYVYRNIFCRYPTVVLMIMRLASSDLTCRPFQGRKGMGQTLKTRTGLYILPLEQTART